MAVSSYRKSFAVANTSNTGGKLLVLQTQDSHRTNLRAVRSQVDNGLPRGFCSGAKGAAAAPRSGTAGGGVRADRRSAQAVVVPCARAHEAAPGPVAERRSRSRQQPRRRRPASATAALPHPVAAAGSSDRRKAGHAAAAAPAPPPAAVRSTCRVVAAARRPVRAAA